MKLSASKDVRAFSLLTVALSLAFTTTLIAVAQIHALKIGSYANSVSQSSPPLFGTKADIAGLIDINTVRLDLMEEVLSEASLLVTDQIQTLRERRAKGQPFPSVADFLSLPELANQNTNAIRPFFTVHSGQSGVAPEHAPLGLLELLTGRIGERAFLERAIRPEWKSAPTNRIFRRPLGTSTSGQPHTYAIYVKNGGIETRYSLIALD